MEHRAQEEGRNHQREREWNRPRLPSWSTTPEIHRRHSQEFRSSSHAKSFSHESAMSQGGATRSVHRQQERRDSLTSLRSFDDDHSSRPSSIGSQADCQYFPSSFFLHLKFYQIEIESRSLSEKEIMNENENGTNDIHRPDHPRV